MSPLIRGLMTTSFSPCKPQMGLQVRYLALNPHPTTWLFPWYEVQDLQQVLWARAEDIERRTRLDPLRRC